MFKNKWFALVTIILLASMITLPPGVNNSAAAKSGLDQMSGHGDTKTLNTNGDIGKIAYFTIPDNNELVLIDTTQHAISSTIDLAQFECITPHNLGITPDGNKLYIFCSSSSDLLILDIATYSSIAKIHNSGWDYDGDKITFTQNGAYALVSATQEHRIDVIDNTSFTVVNSIPACCYVGEIAVHPYLPLAYASFGDYSATGGILVIDLTTLP